MSEVLLPISLLTKLKMKHVNINLQAYIPISSIAFLAKHDPSPHLEIPYALLPLTLIF